MGRFKEFLSKAMGGQTQALNLSGMSEETVSYEGIGYDEALDFISEAYDLSFWHNVEADEEDLPEGDGDLLLAYRDPSKKKGYRYQVGRFDENASGWKELRFTDAGPKNVQIDEDFFEARIKALHEEMPNVLDFTPAKSAYVAGFLAGMKKMKDKIRKYKWHGMDKLEEELTDMNEEVLAAVSLEGGQVGFEVVEDRAFSMQQVDERFIAWANMEPFENIMDMI